MKTAGRKCFATAENLQVQSDHQTVTLHLAWRLRSVDGYLPYRTGCRTFVSCSLSHFFRLFDPSNTDLLLNIFPLFLFSSSQISLLLLHFMPSFLLLPYFLLSNLTPSCFCVFLPLSYLPLQTFSFLPLSPSFSFCLWSVTHNLHPSICFSSFVLSGLFLIKITSGFDLLVCHDPFEVILWLQVKLKATTLLTLHNRDCIWREKISRDQNDFFFLPQIQDR